MNEGSHESAFAMIGLKVNVADTVPATFSLDADAAACRQSPLPLDDSWRRTLGSLRVQEWNASNLFLTVRSGHELNERLLSRVVTAYFYKLLIQGAAYVNGGLSIAGTHSGSRYDVKLVQPLSSYSRPRGVLSQVIDDSMLESLAPWVTGLLAVYSHEGGNRYLRIRKGFNALLGGKLESRDDARIHQFVRAVEAVIRPSRGSTRRQFVHRCQVFAGRSSGASQIVGELFDLRSTAEHVNPIEDLYRAASKDVRDKTVAERTYQAELLADSVYRRLFSSSDMLEHFTDDASSERFWSHQDHELDRLWHDTIDLTDLSQGRFRADMIHLW